jgi:hypothetical protein
VSTPNVVPAFPYRYHFAYYTGRAGGFGFGNQSVSLANPVRTEADLQLVVDLIRDANPGNTTVVILSWQRFEDDASDPSAVGGEPKATSKESSALSVTESGLAEHGGAS